MVEARVESETHAWVGQASRFVPVIALGVLCIALAVLIGGWLLGNETLVRLHPSYTPMMPSTAVAFALVSVAMLAGHARPRDSRGLMWLIATLLALAPAVDFVLTLGGAATGLGRSLAPEVTDPAWPAMALSTAFCFVLLAICLVTLDRNAAGGHLFVGCATLGLLVAMTVAVGYLFDAAALYEVSLFTTMALHTAWLFIALFLALLLMRPDIGWLVVLLSAEAGSAGARRLFPIVVILPCVLGLLALEATRSGMIDATFRLSLIAVLMMALLTMAILNNATIENRAQRRLTAVLDELRAAVAERDLLLQELHHRVKNNLQQIIGLIMLEASRMDGPEAKAAFRSTELRIRALGTAHKLLVPSDMPSRVSTRNFIRELCASIADSTGIENRNIALTVDAVDDDIHIDRAVTIGLLLNELITNSIKHAFEGRAVGEVRVAYRAMPDGARVLAVSDNGVGMPKLSEETLVDSGAGGRIVGSLVRQLRGEVSLEQDQGTRIVITIPTHPKEPEING